MEQIQKPLTVQEVIELTGYSRWYVYKLIHLKKLKGYKPTGGKLFFRQNEIEEFIFRNRQEAVSHA